MNNEDLIRKLIKCSIHRAIQESAAALFVLIAFGAILQYSAVGSPRYYGCLVILVGTGFIAGVVWSFALSYRLLRTHPATDTSFWREAFDDGLDGVVLFGQWDAAEDAAAGPGWASAGSSATARAASGRLCGARLVGSLHARLGGFC